MRYTVDENCLIGSKIPEPRPTVFELRIYDHVQKLDPAKYGISGLPVFDPGQYFITSGDAIAKTRYMSKIAWAYAGQVKSIVGKSPKKKKAEFLKMAWATAGEVTRLLNHLIAARGDAIFLETDFREHHLLVVAKNPRVRE